MNTLRIDRQKKGNIELPLLGVKIFFFPPLNPVPSVRHQRHFGETRERVFHHEISHFSFLSVDDDDDDDPIVCVDHRHKSWSPADHRRAVEEKIQRPKRDLLFPSSQTYSGWQGIYTTAGLIILFISPSFLFTWWMGGGGVAHAYIIIIVVVGRRRLFLFSRGKTFVAYTNCCYPPPPR